MKHSELIAEAKHLSGWQRHKFLLLVGLTIVTALFLVTVAMSLYSSSGTAQLDLSRPGYKSVRGQAPERSDFDAFPSDGPIDKDTFDSFRKIYNSRTQKAAKIDGFSGDVLDEKLLLNDGVPQQQ